MIKNSNISQVVLSWCLYFSHECEEGLSGRCTMKVQVDSGERNWTLTGQNPLGNMTLVDTADLTKRGKCLLASLCFHSRSRLSWLSFCVPVHMFAPEGLTVATEQPRNATVQWRWMVQQYNNLNITCQFNVSNGELNKLVSWQKKEVRHTISELRSFFCQLIRKNDVFLDWTFWSWPSFRSFVRFDSTCDI